MYKISNGTYNPSTVSFNASFGESSSHQLNTTGVHYFDPQPPPGGNFGPIFSTLASFGHMMFYKVVVDISFLNDLCRSFSPSLINHWFQSKDGLGKEKTSLMPFRHKFDVFTQLPNLAAATSFVYHFGVRGRTMAHLVVKDKIKELEAVLGYHFNNVDLIIEALSHSSYVAESGLTVSNERLEFLGDSVLGLVISDLIIKTSEYDEGDLTVLRSALVDAKACHTYFNKLGINSYLLLGEGKKQEIMRGIGLESIYSDYFEAILGAVYRDGGLEAAKAFCLQHCKPHFDEVLRVAMANLTTNWKGKLQEHCVGVFKRIPQYQLIKSAGAEHQPTFIYEVSIAGQFKAQGEGKSKKEAQQRAARKAYEALTKS